ncbi:Zinc finger CCCH domain-containing protein 44 [Acorus gramineus]|uniref:Zinc finger CCCH domain-containing protein 44 n=1 Tax=Acorus gramineus TaxID=55184 RepID=A0AAV9ADN3_ACOGR|nr:Zinc finger CCCH domain-containing protein 44 [Acorus gramineus]
MTSTVFERVIGVDGMDDFISQLLVEGGDRESEEEDEEAVAMVEETAWEVLRGRKGSGGKRKRGRPAKAQAQSMKKKKKKEGEEVCFICLDGGNLVVCDHRNCEKVYHPSCVDRDEAFFKSKGQWNCGWHICSICEKASHYMCYTCTFSLCKGCVKEAGFSCIRGNKGLCETCMRTVILIETNEPAKGETGGVDFNDKSSWEYLFKYYWLDLKGKLSLNLEEVTGARNLLKGSTALCHNEDPSDEIYEAKNDLGSSSDSSLNNIGAKDSTRRKTKRKPKSSSKRRASVKVGAGGGTWASENTGWASKVLIDFVSHMKNGDKSVLSQFDVQALLLEYIKQNNLRDPRRKSQIICDAMLENLFGKARVGHFEMLKLLEYHFPIKEASQVSTDDTLSDAEDSDSLYAEEDSDGADKSSPERRRKGYKKFEEKKSQSHIDDYAAIDAHNINLIYLRRNLMEELLDDADNFHGKVVGFFVRIRISGLAQKQDMCRLVQVVGTGKAVKMYKTGKRTTDITLEILNLNKIEVVTIDTISNQDFTEEECKRLRQSIKCGLINRLTVGEVQEKARLLQAMRINDWLEKEKLRLGHLRDRASEKGRRKEHRECVEKLQLLSSPEEWSRRLNELPEVHSDPNMDPTHESADEDEDNDDKKRGVVPNTASTPTSNVSENEKIWNYVDPNGKTQGPFSMTQLRKWSSTGFFPPDHKIWRNTEKQEDAILLSDALVGKFQKSPPQWPAENSFQQAPGVKVVLENRENNRKGDGRTSHYPSLNDGRQNDASWRSKWNTGVHSTAVNERWLNQSLGYVVSKADETSPKEGWTRSSSRGWEQQKDSSGRSHDYGSRSSDSSSGRSNRYKGRDDRGRNSGRWNADQNSGNSWGSDRSIRHQSGSCGHEKLSSSVSSGWSPKRSWRLQGNDSSKGWRPSGISEAPGARNDLPSPLTPPRPNTEDRAVVHRLDGRTSISPAVPENTPISHAPGPRGIELHNFRATTKEFSRTSRGLEGPPHTPTIPINSFDGKYGLSHTSVSSAVKPAESAENLSSLGKSSPEALADVARGSQGERNHFISLTASSRHCDQGWTDVASSGANAGTPSLVSRDDQGAQLLDSDKPLAGGLELCPTPMEIEKKNPALCTESELLMLSVSVSGQGSGAMDSQSVRAVSGRDAAATWVSHGLKYIETKIEGYLSQETEKQSLVSNSGIAHHGEKSIKVDEPSPSEASVLVGQGLTSSLIPPSTLLPLNVHHSHTDEVPVPSDLAVEVMTSKDPLRNTENFGLAHTGKPIGFDVQYMAPLVADHDTSSQMPILNATLALEAIASKPEGEPHALEFISNSSASVHDASSKGGDRHSIVPNSFGASDVNAHNTGQRSITSISVPDPTSPTNWASSHDAKRSECSLPSPTPHSKLPSPDFDPWSTLVNRPNNLSVSKDTWKPSTSGAPWGGVPHIEPPTQSNPGWPTGAGGTPNNSGDVNTVWGMGPQKDVNANVGIPDHGNVNIGWGMATPGSTPNAVWGAMPQVNANQNPGWGTVPQENPNSGWAGSVGKQLREIQICGMHLLEILTRGALNKDTGRGSLAMATGDHIRMNLGMEEGGRHVRTGLVEGHPGLPQEGRRYAGFMRVGTARGELPATTCIIDEEIILTLDSVERHCMPDTDVDNVLSTTFK